MTARSNESPKEILSGQQALEALVLNAERKLTKELGNSERAERWQKVKFYNRARQEWFDACKWFVRAHRLESLFHVQAGVQHNLKDYKNFVLALFGQIDQPERVLKNQASVIYAAASEGDLEFFRKIGLAFRNRSRAKAKGFSLSYSILLHWFAGLLWLMNEEAGYKALRSYTNKMITKDAYRKACARLRLKGYRHRMRAPAVLAFQPRTRSYQYAAKWTRMEPSLST